MLGDEGGREGHPSLPLYWSRLWLNFSSTVDVILVCLSLSVVEICNTHREPLVQVKIRGVLVSTLQLFEIRSK